MDLTTIENSLKWKYILEYPYTAGDASDYGNLLLCWTALTTCNHYGENK